MGTLAAGPLSSISTSGLVQSYHQWLLHFTKESLVSENPVFTALTIYDSVTWKQRLFPWVGLDEHCKHRTT
jgi:hypothetical protein